MGLVVCTSCTLKNTDSRCIINDESINGEFYNKQIVLSVLVYTVSVLPFPCSVQSHQLGMCVAVHLGPYSRASYDIS